MVFFGLVFRVRSLRIEQHCDKLRRVTLENRLGPIWVLKHYFRWPENDDDSPCIISRP